MQRSPYPQAPPEVEARIVGELPAGWRQSSDDNIVPRSSASSNCFRLEAWLEATLEQTGPEMADQYALACISLFKRMIASQTLVLSLARARQAANPTTAGPPLTAISDAEIAAAAAEGRLPETLAAAGILGVNGGLLPMSPAEAAAQEAAARDAVIKPDVAAALARTMRRNHRNVNPSLSAAMVVACDAAVSSYPILQVVSTAEIEDLANSYFKAIYTSQQTMSEVVEMLRRFKNSTDARERDIFRCMLHNLFDEYRFFHKYPEKELRITGVIFGLLIMNGLVTGLTLGVALRYVLEALRRPPNTPANAKMYRFGLYALEQFRSRLPKWPQYCAHIVALRHLRESQPEFVKEIQVALASGHASDAPMIPVCPHLR